MEDAVEMVDRETATALQYLRERVISIDAEVKSNAGRMEEFRREIREELHAHRIEANEFREDTSQFRGRLEQAMEGISAQMTTITARLDSAGLPSSKEQTERKLAGKLTIGGGLLLLAEPFWSTVGREWWERILGWFRGP